MPDINVSQVKQELKNALKQCNCALGEDVLSALISAKANETSPIGQTVLAQLIENSEIARRENLPVCQDTGMVVVFARLGQQVHLQGDLNAAINEAVAEAYQEAYFRNSIVSDPLFSRTNTGDNTPAVVYTELTKGNKLELLVACKGFGSENMSALKMLTPAEGETGLFEFVVDTVKRGGANPCPPIIVGVGVGGTMDKAAQLAKLATLRPVGEQNSDERYAKLERELLLAITKLGIGPGGLGGRTSALTVNVEYFPTHIAGLPVAVNICCHANRHARLTFGTE